MSGKYGVCSLIARRVQLSNQLGFAPGWVVGQFKAEGGRSMAPEGGVGGIFPAPMAQQALAHVAFAHKKRLAFLVPQPIDAGGVGCLEFDP